MEIRKVNYELTSYGDCWRMRFLNFMACRRLRIPVHVDGYPFGWPKKQPPEGISELHAC